MFLLLWTSKISLQKPLQNLSKNLSKSTPQKVEFAYIYGILKQPGLTLEREAPFNFIAKVSLKQAKQTKQSNHTQF